MAVDTRMLIRILAQADEAISKMRQVRTEMAKMQESQVTTAKKSTQSSQAAWAAAKRADEAHAQTWKNMEMRNQQLNASYMRTAFVIGTVAAALGYATKKVADTVAGVELAELTFQSFTGSATLAKRRYEELLKFAAETPLQVGDIVRGTTTMLAFGMATMDSAEAMAELKHRMLLFGLAAKTSQLPGGVDQVIRAMNDLKNGVIEIRQLSGMGLSREALGAQGIKFDKSGGLASSGADTFAAGMRILEQRYGALVEQVGSTLSTKMSNVVDKLFIVLMRIGQPLTDSMKSAVTSVVEYITRLGDVAQKNGELIRNTLGASAAVLAPLWAPVVLVFKGFLALADKAPGLLSALAVAITAVSAAMVLNNAASLLMASRFGQIITNVIALTQVFGMGMGLKAALMGTGQLLLAFTTSLGGFLTIIGLATLGVLKLSDAISNRLVKATEKASAHFRKLSDETMGVIKQLEANQAALKGLAPMMAVTEKEALPLMAAFKELVTQNAAVASAAGLHATATGVLDDALGREIKTVNELAAAQSRLRHKEQIQQIETLKAAYDASQKTLEKLTSEYLKYNDYVTMLRHSYGNLVGAIAGYIGQSKALQRAQKLETENYLAQLAALQALNQEMRQERTMKGLSGAALKSNVSFTNPGSRAGYENLTPATQDVLGAFARSFVDATGSPLSVTSTYRDPATNARVGGVKNSLHLSGRAFDIPGSDLRKLAEKLGSISSALIYLSKAADEAGGSLLVEGQYAELAKNLGLRYRYKGAGLHVDVRSGNEKAMDEATLAGVKYDESAAAEAERERKKLADEKIQNAKKEYDDKLAVMELEAETLQLGMDEHNALLAQVKFESDKLELMKKYVTPGVFEAVDIKSQELAAAQAQYAVQEDINAENLRIAESTEQMIADMKAERDRIQQNADELAGTLGDSQMKRLDTMRKEHERERQREGFIPYSQEERSQREQTRFGEEAKFGTELKAELEASPSFQMAKKAIRDAIIALFDTAVQTAQDNGDDAAASTREAHLQFYRDLKATINAGIMDVGRSIASGDINSAISNVFLNLANIIAQKVALANTSGFLGAAGGSLMGAGIMAVVGFGLNALFGKKKQEQSHVIVDNPYLVTRWDKDYLSFILPRNAWMRGEVSNQFNMEGITVNNGASASQIARQASRQIERTLRRGLAVAV